ncbi:MAG: TatD family hydrolase, partial [Kiritimatiellae bacterium]|nr:TatD family hydrolase [Kiritimatiellia bacterium]
RAAALGLPCSVHCREADDDLVAILRECTSPALAAAGRSGALHCFVGQSKLLEALVPLGWSFGISGILTFPNARELREAVREIPRDRLLVETDSPFLAPAPHRGETCEPAYVAHTARRLADVLGIPFEECGRLTTANALRVFGGAAG